MTDLLTAEPNEKPETRYRCLGCKRVFNKEDREKHRKYAAAHSPEFILTKPREKRKDVSSLPALGTNVTKGKKKSAKKASKKAPKKHTPKKKKSSSKKSPKKTKKTPKPKVLEVAA